jgi:hypothetical protein
MRGVNSFGQQFPSDAVPKDVIAKPAKECCSVSESGQANG